MFSFNNFDREGLGGLTFIYYAHNSMGTAKSASPGGGIPDVSIF
jgi:hypothetical protein